MIIISEEEHKSKQVTHAWGIASLILGIISLLLFAAPYIGIFLAILAVVFYGIQKRHKVTGTATAGLVTGIIGIVLNSIMLILIIGIFSLVGIFNSHSGETGKSVVPSGENIKSVNESCIPDWQCSEWSSCSSYGNQIRTCTELNNCGSVISKPTEIQTCVPTPTGGIYFKGEASMVDKGFGMYYIIGELLNNGTKSYKNYEIQIVADLYKGDKLVGTESGFPTTNLPTGGTSSFEIMLYNPPSFDIYKLKVSTY